MKGIYFLYQKDKIVYVGKSLHNMENRIRSHYFTKEFDKAVIHEVSSDADIAVIEMYLIGVYKPLYNIDAKSNDFLNVRLGNIADYLGPPIDVSSNIHIYAEENSGKKEQRMALIEENYLESQFRIIEKITDSLISEGYTLEDIVTMCPE